MKEVWRNVLEVVGIVYAVMAMITFYVGLLYILSLIPVHAFELVDAGSIFSGFDSWMVTSGLLVYSAGVVSVLFVGSTALVDRRWERLKVPPVLLATGDLFIVAGLLPHFDARKLLDLLGMAFLDSSISPTGLGFGIVAVVLIPGMFLAMRYEEKYLIGEEY